MIQLCRPPLSVTARLALRLPLCSAAAPNLPARQIWERTRTRKNTINTSPTIRLGDVSQINSTFVSHQLCLCRMGGGVLKRGVVIGEMEMVLHAWKSDGPPPKPIMPVWLCPGREGACGAERESKCSEGQRDKGKQHSVTVILYGSDSQTCPKGPLKGEDPGSWRGKTQGWRSRSVKREPPGKWKATPRLMKREDLCS